MPKAWGALGSKGLSFTRAYTAVCRCGPSRASFFTGLYPERSGVSVNAQAAEVYRRVGNHKRDILYRLATEVGYRTGLFGKWENEYAAIPAFVPPGIGEWVGTLTHGKPITANVNGVIKQMGYGMSGEARELAEKVAGFVGRSETGGQPWFCLYAPNVPHKPATPSVLNKGSYAGEPMWDTPNMYHHDPNKPKEVREIGGYSDGEKAVLRQKWRGMMEEVRDLDGGVERVLSAVDLENTYVFFVTDNSTLWGEHRLRDKSQPYEESARSHLWVAGPGVGVGTRGDLTVNVDLTATIYELAGLGSRALETDGRSLLPAMVGAVDRPRRFALLLDLPPDPSPNKQFEGWKAIRTVYPENRLYVEHGTGESELYDMDADPYQLASLQNDPARAEEAVTLSRKLASLRGVGGENLRAAENV